MSDHWELYDKYINDMPAIILYDHGISKEIDGATQRLLIITAKFKSPSENGMPSKEDYQIVGKIDKKIEETSELQKWRYVGAMTHNGSRSMYVYSEDKDSEKILQPIEQMGLTIKYEIKLDIGHKQYWDNLFPTPEEYQIISNGKVIESLEKHNDKHEKIRRVDHWIYFKDLGLANKFKDIVVKDGFLIDGNVEIQNDKSFKVQVYSNTSVVPKVINTITIKLFRMAKENGGEYDGWETFIVNE